MIARGIPQFIHIHRHRLGPTKQDATTKESNERENDGAEHIRVDDRIQADAAEESRRGITQHVGRKRMRRLMHAEREEQHDELNGREKIVHMHLAMVARPLFLNISH